MTYGNGESVATAAWALKNGMYQAALSVYDASSTLVCMGLPDTTSTFEIVSIGNVSTSQAPATMGTNRAREETLEQIVQISVFAGGGADVQVHVEQRAVELLQLLEQKVHYRDGSGVDGTTLGGVVRECFLTGIAQDSMPATEGTTTGREANLSATFTAKARVGL